MRKQLLQLYSDQLDEAFNTRHAINSLTSTVDLTEEEAYQIQMINVNRRLKQEEVISGKKIGLTSLAMQKMLGIKEPDYGHLFSSMFIQDNKVLCSKLIQAKVEAELAFVLKKDLNGSKVTIQDVEDATDYVVAALEIIDSRIIDWQIKLSDTIADNASAAYYVLGKTKLLPQEVNYKNTFMRLHKKNKQTESLINEGYSSAVLGDPRLAVAWLANKLSHYGLTLKAGEVILSGAFTTAHPIKKADYFKAIFSDFGTVELWFI